MIHRADNYILMCVDQSNLDISLFSTRIQSLVGRSLLIMCLKELGVYKEWPVYHYGSHGKPYLSNYPGWFFNISHCRKAVVCIVSTEETGVDVEVIDEDNLSLAAHVLNEEVLTDVISSADPKRAFCRYWTKKESLLKCNGIGIDDDLKELLKTQHFQFESFSNEEYEICIY